MPRRILLSHEQHKRLFGFAIDRAEMAKHHIFNADDKTRIRPKRRSSNRLGFALQFCTFRFPGRARALSEAAPAAVLAFVAAQLEGIALKYAKQR